MRCPTPQTVYPHGNNKAEVVPCGKCLACLKTKRDDWSFRLMQEYKVSDSGCFITLTYHSKYVPDYGVSKRHFQLFMKRLRKKNGKIRYYAVGEYGTKTKRPHYHAVIFGLQATERIIRDAWPYGLVHVGKVTEASIRYCTKYVIQRQESIPKGFAKPFALMSRAYGLGAKYLTDGMMRFHWNAKTHWESHPLDARNYTFIHGEKGKLPRYYKEKIWPDKDVRRSISKKSALDARLADLENDAYLRKRGYDPEKIKAEMRNAVLSRMKEKIAFSQII